MAASGVQGEKAVAPSPRYQPLVPVAVAVCAGIVADRFGAWPVGLWWSAGVVACGAWWMLWRRGLDRAAGLTILAAAAACGGAWHHCRWTLFEDDDLGFSARRIEQPVCLEGIVRSGPRRVLLSPHDPMQVLPQRDRTRVELEVVGVRDGSSWERASGRARLTVAGEIPGVFAGDRLRIFGQLGGPQPARNPGEFDFAAHCRADRLPSLLRTESPECLSVVEPGPPLSVWRWIDAVRKEGDRVLWRHLDPARAGVASAVLLGCREEVTMEQTEAFVQTGTVHILSISGMHVGILAALVFALARLLPVSRGTATTATATVAVLYTLLTDAQPPAIRAMILVLVMCGAYGMGRRPLAMNSLAAAALVVLILNPADLFRTGVQLSFLCMIVIFGFNSQPWPRGAARAALQRLIEKTRPWPIRKLRSVGHWILELALVGLAIWIVTAPLVMARFHICSPVALVLSTLLWVPMTAALWTGLGLLVAGAVCPPLAPILGWSCDRTIAVLQGCIETARGWPGSYFWLPGPADWWLAGFYGALGIMLAWPRLRPPWRWRVAILALWVAVGFGVPLAGRDRPHLACTFVSLGHGCGTVLRLPSGATLLYDAGTLGSPRSAINAISACLWSEGITRIDAVLLSHADADHYNALPGLLERFSVGSVFVPPGMLDHRTRGLQALQDAIRGAKIPIRETWAGDRFSGGEDCRIEVLHPPRRGILGSDNANSLVLAIEYLGRRILLMGDLEPPGFDDVLRELPWHTDVLLAPHHGSRASRPPGLMRWCTPRIVVVSGSASRDLAQTMAAYRAEKTQVLHTAREGAVHVRMDEGGLRVATELRSR